MFSNKLKLLIIGTLLQQMVLGQLISTEKLSVIKDAEIFPELVMANIKGAPKLGTPMLITGELKPVLAEGRGWISPAFYDINGDGKKDLLIGEFGSGLESGQAIGSFIRTYLNSGSDSLPKFSGQFKYLEHPFFESGNGTPVSIFTWCCTSIHPQFFDLNDDGYDDMLTGQYQPGDVVWFKGSKKGFLPGENLIQTGNPAANKINLPITDSNSLWYWNYSEVSFGDFDNDGDFDMVVGGAALRISENIGTKSNPRFGSRQYLLDINDKPLELVKRSNQEMLEDKNLKYFTAGTYNTTPLIVDWDQDGTLDLLVTTGYYSRAEVPVTFFKGVKTSKGYRFQLGIPLFEAKNGGKAFPGSWIRVYVTDWNKDGLNDLLIGSSVVTLNGQFDYKLSWNWEQETHTLKMNPGLYEFDWEMKTKLDKKFQNSLLPQAKETRQEIIKSYYRIEEYKTLIHQGYIYVMLGKK